VIEHDFLYVIHLIFLVINQREKGRKLSALDDGTMHLGLFENLENNDQERKRQ
jgi:hypothetical protein